MPIDFKTYLDDLNKTASRKYSAKEILRIMPKSEFTNIPDDEIEESHAGELTPVSPTSHFDSFLAKHPDRDPEILKEGFSAVQERVKNKDGIKYGEPITADYLEELGRERIKQQAPGLLKEGLRSLARGAIDLPGMAGKGTQWLDPDGGNETISDIGKKLEAFSTETQTKYEPSIGISKQAEISPWYSPRHMIARGPESMVASLAPFATGLAAGAVAGPVAGLAAGLATLGGLFYGGAAEDKYRQAKESGLSDEDAKSLANWEGGIEAGGELIADLIPIRLFGAAAKPVKDSIIKGLTARTGIKDTLKAIGNTMVAETATEVGQAMGQTYTSNQYGVDAGSMLDNSLDVIGPAIFMSPIFGGTGAAHTARMNQKKTEIVRALSDPASTQEDFDNSLGEVAQAARSIDPKVAKQFTEFAVKKREQGQPVIIGDDSLYAPAKQNLAQWLQTGQRNGQEFTPVEADQFIREKLSTGEFTDNDLQSIKEEIPAIRDVATRIDAERITERAKELSGLTFQMADNWNKIQQDSIKAEEAEFDQEWNRRAGEGERRKKRTEDLEAQKQRQIIENKKILSDPTYLARKANDYKMEGIESEGVPFNQGQEEIDRNVKELSREQQFKRYAADSIRQKKLGEEFQARHMAENQKIDERLKSQKESILSFPEQLKAEKERRAQRDLIQSQKVEQEREYQKRIETERKAGKIPQEIGRVADYQKDIVEGTPRNLRIAKKSHAIDMLIQQANGTQTRSHFYDKATGQNIALPATSPRWMKDFGGALTRKEIENLATKYRNQVLEGKQTPKKDLLTEKQRGQINEYILPAINKIMTDHADEFKSKVEMEQDGYKFVSKPIVAFDFNPGDTLLDFNGNAGESEVIGTSENGIIIKLPNGKTSEIDGFDAINVSAFKEGNGQGKQPEGYVPEKKQAEPQADLLQSFINKAQSATTPDSMEEMPTIEGLRQKLQGYRQREQEIQNKIDSTKDAKTKEHLNKRLENVQGKIAAIETETTPTESTVRLKFKTLDDARKDFIDKKIQEIGSIEAVQAKYKDDAVVDNYARERATEIFGEAEPTPNKSGNTESQRPTETTEAEPVTETKVEQIEKPKPTEVEETAATTVQPPTYGAKNKVFTADQAAKARELLKRKLSGTQLNAGIDPEVMLAGIELGGYHVEAGARKFVDFAEKMIADIGESIRPYLKSFYNAVRDYPDFDNKGMNTYQEVEEILKKGEKKNEPDINSDANMERDSKDAGTKNGMGEEGIQDEPGGNDRTGESGIPGDEKTGNTSSSDQSVFRPETTTAGERSDITPYTEDTEPTVKGGTPGSDNDSRGGDIGFTGAERPSYGTTQEQADKNATERLDLNKRLEAQKEVNSTTNIKIADKADIKRTLPLLLPKQQDDVLFAEKRFAKPDGFGVMFTNGTGTGKTFSALGIIKRVEMQGKKNILIIAPDDLIIDAWTKAAPLFGLDISKLANTKEAGSGINITTYANLGNNQDLVNRNFDLIVADEAHQLSMNKSGDRTGALESLRAISMHPAGWYSRHKALDRAIINEFENISNEIEESKLTGEFDKVSSLDEKRKSLINKLAALREKRQEEVKSFPKEKRPRVVFLSATPFAYEKNVDYTEGYLFDYPTFEKGGYNSADGREQFFIQNFGYRMKYNKLTEPDSNVDRGLMQRQFNSWLKKQGVLSGRMLDNEFDYDRKFFLIESAIGNKIDEGLTYIGENYKPLSKIVNQRFDYLQRKFLLEAIKAKEIIPTIKQYLNLGRKVVVFHDYIKGGGFNPFDFTDFINSDIEDVFDGEEATESQLSEAQQRASLRDLARQFMDVRPDLVNLPLYDLKSPIETLRAAFPDLLLEVNGQTVSKKQAQANVNKFNDDNENPSILLVQSDKDKGWSGHDTTGKNPRVLINLGLPTRPTRSIQQEGRIYRVGQASNAVFRYVNTGTNWERWAFADTIARRASTAENLAMGEEARALLDSFVEEFQNSDTYPPGHKGEGTGGKERDRAANNVLTEWDRAVSLYYSQQKRTARNKSQEGTDYFATPEPIGLKMVEWANISAGEKVLEPSAGHGAIARWFPDDANITMVEPSLELASKAKMVSDGKIIQDRFENINAVNKFDAIVMNPPFGVAGKTAMEHIEKAYKHLNDGGRIVALIPSGSSMDKRLDNFLYGEDKNGKLKNPHVYKIASYNLPTNVFERAGTKVSTKIIILDKYTNPDIAQNINSQAIIGDEDHDNINDLFESIKEIGVPNRLPIQETKENSQKKEKLQALTVSDRDAKIEPTKTDSNSFKFDGGRIVDSVDDEKLKVFFSSMPDKKIREKLKVEKFRWNPEGKFWWKARDEDMLNFLKKFFKVEEAAQYSIAATPPGDNLSIPMVQKYFRDKGQTTGVNSDGSLWIRLQNGLGLNIELVTRMSDAEYELAISSGKMNRGGQIAGQITRNNIKLATDFANKETLNHELEHLMENSGILNSDDIKALNHQIKKFNRQGKLEFELSEDDMENRANFLAQVLANREQYRGTVLGNILQKIADFIDSLLYIGRSSTTKIARGVETGRIFSVTPDAKPRFTTIDGQSVWGVLGQRQNEIQSWHGSPYQIDDSFSDKKLGSGEGIAAFGSGHYQTDTRAIAEQYARMAEKRKVANGEMVPITLTSHPKINSVKNRISSMIEDLQSGVQIDGLDNQKAELEDIFENKWTQTPAPVVREIEKLEEFYNRNLKELGSLEKQAPGYLYQSTIHKGKTPDQYDYMDWYQPLTEGQRAKLAAKNVKGIKPEDTTELIYKKLTKRLGSPRAATQFLLKAGIDGIKYKAGSLSGVKDSQATNYVVFDPKEITINERIQYSIAPTTEERNDPLDIPERSSLFDTLKYTILNNLDPFKKVQEKLGGVSPEADVLAKETLRISKAKNDIDEGKERYVNPIMKLIADNNKSVDDVDEYLYSRHAPEANERLKYTTAKEWLLKLDKIRNSDALRKKIKEIDEYLLLNPAMNPKEAYYKTLVKEFEGATEDKELALYDKWKFFISKPSGMTTEDANKLQEKWANDETMKKIAVLFDKMNHEKLDISLAAGRMTPEEHQAISGAFEYYAPLHREGYDSAPSVGRGVTNLGRDTMARGGSTLKAVDILANAIASYETTIGKAHKAETARAFKNFIDALPENSNFINLIRPNMRAEYDNAGNIRHVIAQEVRDNQVKFKVDGVTYLAEANRRNQHAMRIIEHIKDNPSKSGWLVEHLNKVNRVLALVNTSLSPEFMFSNFIRDLQTASINLSDSQVSGLTKKIVTEVPTALKALHNFIRGDKSHGWSETIRQYNKAGAPIGWMDNIGDIEQRVKKLDKEIELLRPAQDIAKNRRALVLGHRQIKKVFNVIMDYNNIVENAVRLSTFKNVVDAGVSVEQAAILAKGLTVNFNQKGTMGSVMNSLYLFSNAGIQGSAKIISVLIKSKRARKIVGTSMLISAALAVANRGMGGDDDDGIPYYDKIDQFVKERNIILMIPGGKGKYAQLPLPWGYNVFWAMGEELGVAFGTDKKYNAFEGASRMLTTTLNAFNPLQSATIAQTLSPTLFDPVVHVAENKTWSGSPLMPERNTFAKVPEPDSQRYWDSARQPSVWIAKLLNELSLGDEVKPGKIDISPEVLDMVWDTFTGSTGKFVANMISVPIKALSGDDLTMREIPFVRRFSGEKSEYADSKLFRANKEHVYQLHEQAEKYPERIREFKKDKAFYMKSQLESVEKKIKRLYKAKKTAKSDDIADQLQKRIDSVMTKFNAAYYKMVN